MTTRRIINFEDNKPIDQQPMDIDDVHAELSLHKLENQNVQFIQSPGFFIIYGLAIWFGRFLLGLFVPSEHTWTTLNIIHGVVTLYLIHWIKGAPFVGGEESQNVGRFDKKTWWEQLDNGVHWTPTKKILMLIPTFIYFMAIHTAQYQLNVWLILNTVIWISQIIGKLPFMQGVRIFGINKD